MGRISRCSPPSETGGRITGTEAKEVKLPAQLDPSNVTAIIDSREQYSLDLSPLRTITAGLQTGDYSLASLESQVAIERESLSDLVACCGAERERFSREVIRLQAYRCRALVVESTWAEIEAGGWKSKVSAPDRHRQSSQLAGRGAPDHVVRRPRASWANGQQAAVHLRKASVEIIAAVGQGGPIRIVDLSHPPVLPRVAR